MTISPTSPSATGSPVPGRTISMIRSSLTTMPSRAAVAHRAIRFDQLELRFGIAGTGRNHRAAERARGGIEDEAAGGQMIAECVQHHVARPEAGREQRPRTAPGIRVDRFGLENRARRGK